VATDNSYALISWIGSLQLRHKTGGTNNIERGDTKERLGIIDAFGLEDFSADGNRRVDLSRSNFSQYRS